VIVLESIKKIGGIPLRKITLMLVCLLMVASVILSGCAKSDESQVLATARQYVKLMNKEDAGAVFLLTHQEVRSFGYKNRLEAQFAKYDVELKLEKLEFLKIENGYAYAPFVGTMIKKDQSDFKDIRITGTFVLKKENDEWKILGMVYDPKTDVEYLNP
jgi:hypothetical protein